MRGRVARLAAALLAAAGSAEASSPVLRPVAFEALPGFATDDLPAALSAFRAGCARRPPPLLAAPCAVVGGVPERDVPAAERFLRRHFRAYAVEGASPGTLTGYFEPEVEGVLAPSPGFPARLLAMPARLPDPPPDRAAIENGALGAAARPIVFLRDAVDAFTIHVQGSARIRLPDGATIRVGFAGRNGHPYTAIGRVIAERLGVPPSAMPAERVWAWLRDNPGEAPSVMAANRSFIFFRRVPGGAPGAGPVGAAGLPLTPGRSLAVDPAFWPYGLPVWLSGTIPDAAGLRSPLGRLVVAQDTGAAIRGAERGDLFVGSGREAGIVAGLLRDPVRFTVLWPVAAGRPPGAP